MKRWRRNKKKQSKIVDNLAQKTESLIPSFTPDESGSVLMTTKVCGFESQTLLTAEQQKKLLVCYELSLVNLRSAMAAAVILTSFKDGAKKKK